MRKTTKLGLGLLMAGCAVLLVSTGGFESTIADRGMDIGTVDDPDALLGIEFSQADTISLNHTGARSCTGSIGCTYPNEDLLDLSDNVGSNSMAVEDEGYAYSGDDIIYDGFAGNGVRIEGQLADDNAVVRGDFVCPTDGSWFNPPVIQQGAQSTILITTQVSGGDITIELTREVDVECEPE